MDLNLTNFEEEMPVADDFVWRRKGGDLTIDEGEVVVVRAATMGGASPGVMVTRLSQPKKNIPFFF